MQKQVNNLIIKYNKTYEKWQVIKPDKTTVLEEFNTLEQAEEWARTIKDFLVKEEK